MRTYLILPAIILAAAGPVFGQPKQDPPAVDNPSEIDQLVQQQNKLADDYNAILRKIKQGDELVALDKAVAQAKGLLAKAEGDNDALTAARRAEQDAKQAVRQAVEEKLKEHPVGAQLVQRLHELQLKHRQHVAGGTGEVPNEPCVVAHQPRVSCRCGAGRCQSEPRKGHH